MHMPLGVLRGLQTQLTVIHALILRETRTRFGEHRLGYLWAIFEPISVIATFWIAFEFTGRPFSAGMDTATFIATGWLPYELVMSTSERVSQAINSNRALLYYPQVHRLDLVFARTLLESVTIVVVFALTIAGNELWIGPGHFEMEDPLAVMLICIACTIFGMALGLIFCMALVLSNFVERLKGLILRPMFWISGVFFTVEELPVGLREYAMYNPVLQLVEMLRGAWSRGYSATYADPGYVVWWILVLFAVGLTLELYVRRKVEVT